MCTRIEANKYLNYNKHINLPIWPVPVGCRPYGMALQVSSWRDAVIQEEISSAPVTMAFSAIVTGASGSG